MESHIYTILGTLAGVLITSIINYFVESKKSSDRIKEMELQRTHENLTGLLNAKREVFARYLSCLDLYVASGRTDHNIAMKPYYEAAILCGEETTKIIAKSYELIIPDEFDSQAFKAVKFQLLKAFYNELRENA